MNKPDIKPDIKSEQPDLTVDTSPNQQGNQHVLNEMGNTEMGNNETDVNEMGNNEMGNNDVQVGVAKEVRRNDVNDVNGVGDIGAAINADAIVNAASSSRPPQILIAEDEYLIAASIRDALMRYGESLNVVVVQRSNMLVDNINNLKPDVLLMDITLKGAMDGIEAIQRIKSAGRDIPVIYITADSRITTLERAETTKPVAYLIKPFREADLHKALAKALAVLEE